MRLKIFIRVSCTCWSGLSHDFLYLRIGNLYPAPCVDDILTIKVAIFVSFFQDNQALLASSFSEWRREGKNPTVTWTLLMMSSLQGRKLFRIDG